MSKQLKRLFERNPTKVSSAYIDSDGVWIDLLPGWCNDPSTHTIHEDTVAEALRVFRQQVQPCTCCAQCQAVHPHLPPSAFPHKT